MLALYSWNGFHTILLGHKGIDPQFELRRSLMPGHDCDGPSHFLHRRLYRRTREGLFSAQIDNPDFRALGADEMHRQLVTIKRHVGDGQAGWHGEI